MSSPSLLAEQDPTPSALGQILGGLSLRFGLCFPSLLQLEKSLQPLPGVFAPVPALLENHGIATETAGKTGTL